MNTETTTLGISKSKAIYIQWLNRLIEALWLLVLVLVPLGYLEPNYISSEALIAYVEIPKLFILRTLVGLMAVIWVIEWAILGRCPIIPPVRFDNILSIPGICHRSLKTWLNSQPTRWLILAVWVFFGTTLLSTILSGSRSISFWGDVPGQDGYALFNILPYVLLFGVVTTHLKTLEQVKRIIGTLVAVGTVIGAYTILQRFGYDPLEISDISGGIVTGFAGNSIFNAAVLMMTSTVTVAAAAITLKEPKDRAANLLDRLRLWTPTLVTAWLWTFVITIQVLGLAYTESRGPWIGVFTGFVALLPLFLYVSGWRYFGRASIFLGLSVLISSAVYRGSVSIDDPMLWVLPTSILIILFPLASVFSWRAIGRIMIVGGIVATIIILISALQNRDELPKGFTGNQDSSQNVSSADTNMFREALGGRLTHWDVSWDLISQRPWFGFDNLGLTWLRPLIGYGPDLFRSTYLLRSPPEIGTDMPMEADHAHNFLIHQTVEQGYLGLVSALGLFFAIFVVGTHMIRNRIQHLQASHKLLLVMLISLVAGRFIEMMVGVARVSDLSILWVILGMFAALPAIMNDRQILKPDPVPQGVRRHDSYNRAPQSASQSPSVIWRSTLVAVVIILFITLTWVKGVNYVQAAITNQTAVEQYRSGDWDNSLKSTDKSISLAPDVTTYHNNRGNLFLAFLVHNDRFREQSCGIQNDMTYDACVAIESYQSNLNAQSYRPFYYRARINVGNAALNLGLYDVAVQSYKEAADMVPGSKGIRIGLTETYLESGQLEKAKMEVEEFLRGSHSSEARILIGLVEIEIGQIDEGLESLEAALTSGTATRFDRRIDELLYRVYFDRAVILKDSGELASAIEALNTASYFSSWCYVGGLRNYRLGAGVDNHIASGCAENEKYRRIYEITENIYGDDGKIYIW